MIGNTLSHYTILDKIGQGGMGEVYSARDTKLDRLVALKILPPDFANDPDRMKRFIQEAKAASSMNHPNIASIYELGNEANVHFIAMEIVQGETLQQKIMNGPLSHTEILEIAFQAASALEEAHSKGVIHRDIKPVNMMITPRGQLKILDFGLAKMIMKSGVQQLIQPLLPETHSGILLGTVQYLSPEQALGKPVDGRSDLFSLGTVLYQLATGRLPFTGETAIAMIESILHEQPEPPSKRNPLVPPILESVILKCLQKDPLARFQTSGELWAELKGIVAPSGTARMNMNFPSMRHSKRNIALTIGILFLLAAVIFIGTHWHSKGDAIHSIAVLPFANLGGANEMDYLSDGITESIINSLSQVPTLKVLARATVFNYKGKETDPRKAGDELNVDAVVNGSILVHDDKLIVRVNLVNVSDGSQMWGEQYDRPSTDILDVQSAISKEISGQLRSKLTGEEQQRVTRQFTENTEAYRLYLKGRYFWNKRSEEGFRRAIESFDLAIKEDPNYALAYAGLADCYGLMPAWALMPPSVGHPKARAAAERAILLDHSLAEGYAALAHTQHNYDWDWSAAKANYQRAILLNPNYATAHHWYANFLLEMGKPNEAIAEKFRALDLDPLSLIINADFGYLYFQCRQYDHAIVQLKKALELDANFPITYQYLGFVYQQKGMYDEAIAAFQKAVTLLPDSPEAKAQLAAAYAISGRHAEALKIFQELKEEPASGYVVAFDFAMIYLNLGDKVRAMAYLDQAHSEHSYQMSSLKVEPRFDPLRSDPRFIELLQSMKFPSNDNKK